MSDRHYRLPDSVWLRPTGAGYFDTHREKPTRGEGHDRAVEFVPAALIEALEADRDRLAAIVERLTPRVIRLVEKGKAFMVVAMDEPYAVQVATLIEQEERRKGTWDEALDSWIREAAAKGGGDDSAN